IPILDFVLTTISRLSTTNLSSGTFRLIPSFKMFAKTFTLASLATVSSAHMLMNNPVPYGKSNLNNGPLLADGSDFPCKLREGTYDLQGASNVYAQGSTQQLSFTGQAV